VSTLSRSSLLPTPRARLLHGFWKRRSLRTQLLLVVGATNVIALLVGGSAAVLRVRTQTQVEMAASMRLAETLVGDLLKLADQQRSAEQFLASLPTQLRSIRHVRVTVRDAQGAPVPAAPPAGAADTRRTSAYSVFTALVAPPVELRRLPVVVGGQPVGSVDIAGEPGDEIAEFVENAGAVGAFLLLLEAAVIGCLYVLFGRVLDPLAAVVRGLSALEAQDYGIRLRKPMVSELAAITTHFNTLAQALETAHAENVTLNRRLITAQDDERRRTALELHDEVGPCLFGLKANLASVAKALPALPEDARAMVADCLRDMTAIVDHLQAINRSMLDRLRPMALGHVPLKDIVGRLVDDRARQYPQLSFSCDAGALQDSYGDSIDLTVYRCIQEGLTNAVRHARARHVRVALNETPGRLGLTVADDGCGIAGGRTAGLGLRGMQERVAGLGGGYALESRENQGTRIHVTIPVGEPPNALQAGVRDQSAAPPMNGAGA
jgi:two-component system, NarL family, sensor histidine kinase UhpB